MALTEAFTSSGTISTTEWSLTNDSTTIATQTADGIYSLFVDTALMASGDVFAFYLREKVVAGGTQRQQLLQVLSGAQVGPFVTGAFQLMHGWDFTALKISGTDRALPTSTRSVA